ncbi:MAG TPA: DUF4175 family protein, partial [Rhabdaerophilum sp.]|nr:DUF4175 family protein [Rhabdaerophilum sp.]
PAPPAEDAGKQPAKPGIATEKRIVRADSNVAVSVAGREAASFRLAVIPDKAPTVTLNELSVVAASPDRQQPGGVKLGYTLADDYGIAKGE